jgi:hypothetical protein
VATALLGEKEERPEIFAGNVEIAGIAGNEGKR